MSAHRRISIDGPGDGSRPSVQCFACGAVSETDAYGDDALSTVLCTGPTTEHPAYLLSDGTVETCAAHPYSDCRPSEAQPDDPAECCGVLMSEACEPLCVNGAAY